MAHDTSFTLDDSGNVAEWHDGAGRYPSLSAADTVGMSAGLLLLTLLEHSAGGGEPAGQVALLLDAGRDGAQALVTVKGGAPGPDAAQLEAAFEFSAFEQSTAGLEMYDAGSRVVRSNSAALAMRGRTADQVLGNRVADLGSRLPMADFLQQVLDGGDPAVRGKVNGHDGRGQAKVFAVTAFRLKDGRRTIGAGSVIHDVTAQDRAQGAARLLARAHETIGTTLDAMLTARELASAATEDFADAVSVDLIDAVLQGSEAPPPPVGTDIALRRAAFEAPGNLRAVYAVGEMSYFTSPTPYTQAMADLTPRLLAPDTSPSDWLMHDVARTGALKDARIHSMIVLPLSFHGRVLGLASFYRGPRHPVPFDPHDVDLAEQVSATASIHIENARRYTREHTTAVTLQRKLLPKTFPELSAVSTAHFYTPGRRHTVWFDVIALSAARVGLAIGQVPQQGLDASVTMGRFRTALGTLAALELPPDELLAHLDDVTGRILPGSPAPWPSPADAPRCLYAVYDPVGGELTAASAGWPSPLVTSVTGEVKTVDVPVGAPLGQGASYELGRMTVAPESMLTLYSESILESGGRGEDRMAELRGAAACAGHDPKATCDSIVQTLLGRQAADGAAILAVHTHRLPDDRVATWTGDRDPAAVADFRERVGHQLEAWGLESHAFTAEMVVSELVTNVIRHASGNPTIRLVRDRSLTIEVSDEASTAPHLRHARVQDEDGRGLMIVAALARRWGTRYTANGKVIWVEESLDEEIAA
ncbi:SpoIIE family protein phosphatase [Streptomyces sp. NBC_01341]|uniref:SpoIIE family protein phosphatase n=1 Tax=Streptomyces sp. NBC_01341 TaxID=2903831 RepID=UPI002E0D3603|nr:SpoIIE family protein phosphatase [Streptomyces sp. NBC_01341]